MGEQLTRREMIGRAIGAGIAPLFSGLPARMQSAGGAGIIPSWKTELRELAPNVFAYVQAGGPDIPYLGISNAGLVVREDRMMAIDSLPAPLQTKAFIAAAKKVAPAKPFERLIVTHHHGDHIDGAPYFSPIEIVGTEFCRQMILEMAPLPPWEKREGWAAGGEEHKRIPPTTTFDEKITYHYGKLVVELIAVGPAHSWGDAVVYLPEQKILFAGDVAFFYSAPFAHWAHVTKWIETLDRILVMDVDIIVPGHGPIGGKKELADVRDYLETFKREARKRFDAGMTPGKAAADITLGRFDAWLGARDRLAMNTVRLFHEFNGTLLPRMDTEGSRIATEEFNAIVASRPK